MRNVTALALLTCAVEILTVTLSAAMAETTSGPDYITSVFRIDRRMAELSEDLDSVDAACTRAMSAGGYGPACRAAAEENSRAMEKARDLRDEASRLRPPDNNFHRL